MQKRFLSTLLFLACTTAPSASMRMSALTGTPACTDPATLGAVPDDGLSDRAAIQAAIDAATSQPDGGTVCLGAGRWTLDRPPLSDHPYDPYAAISTHSSRPLVIRGVGPETVLELAGDQGATATILIGIDPGAQHVRITELTIDTTASTNTDEQTHAIATGGACSGATCLPIRDVQIDNMRCVHPRNTTARKGDCIRLLGNAPETEVYDVRIISNHFEDAARSDVMLQRGLHGVLISGNTIHCESCDQQIDGEATGGGWDHGLVISNNVVTSGSTVQGDYAIALTSTDGAIVAGNKLDRGVSLYRTHDVAVTGNAIAAIATTSTTDGTIVLRNVCDGDVISGNTIRRTGAAGPVISLAPQSGGICAGASIANNALTQGTPRWTIYAEAFGRGAITGNAITYTVPAPAFSSIYDRSTVAEVPVTALAISGNSVDGAVTYGVTLEGYPGSFGGGVAVTGNVASGTVFGLRCKNPAQFTQPITIAGNALGPSSYLGVLVNAGD